MTHRHRAQRTRRNPRGSVRLFSTCPHCGKRNPHHDGVAIKGTPRRRPQPGDASLCIGCGRWSIFDDNRKLRKPTDAELAELAASPLAAAVRQAWERTVAELRPAAGRT